MSPSLLTSLAMQAPYRASQGTAFMVLLALGPGLACGDDEPRCIDGETLWSAPPAELVCIRGDLVVSGRHPDELGVFAQVEEIEGSLVVHENPGLDELPPWPALVRIGGSVSISNNPTLVAIRGLPALEDLAGGLYVAENAALEEFTFSDRVTAVHSLFFGLNPRLDAIGGMSGLERIEQDARFLYNASLAAINLPRLTEVGEDLVLQGNPALREPEFPALREVGESWSVVDNDALEEIAGFPALERVSAADIHDNDALEEITWTISWLSSRLSIQRNSGLRELTGSASARFDDAALVFINRNPQLGRVEGFSGVTTLSHLTLEENDALQEISGFAGLNRVGGALRILHNPSLLGPADLFVNLAKVEDVWLFGNASLPPATVGALLAHVAVSGTSRVGDNGGEDTALDPCPWADDGHCDADWGWQGAGTGLCAADPDDCEDPW